MTDDASGGSMLTDPPYLVCAFQLPYPKQGRTTWAAAMHARKERKAHLKLEREGKFAEGRSLGGMGGGDHYAVGVYSLAGDSGVEEFLDEQSARDLHSGGGRGAAVTSSLPFGSSSSSRGSEELLSRTGSGVWGDGARRPRSPRSASG